MYLSCRRISIIYVLISVLWITFSDKLLFLFHEELSPSTFLLINSSKGFLFVLITGFLIYKLVKKNEDQLRESEEQYRRGAIMDIEALKRSIEENKRLAEIITKINNMIIVINTNDQVTWVNKAFEDYTGYTAGEVLGKQPIELMASPDTPAETWAYINKCKSRLETFSVDLSYNIHHKQQWVNIEYTPLFDNGKYTGYIAVHQNITAYVEKQEQIKKQNKALQQIAWLSSHEVRRPIASILGLVSLSKDTESGKEKDEIIKLISHCAEELDGIVHEITKKVQI